MVAFAQLGSNPNLMRANVGRFAIYLERKPDGRYHASIILDNYAHVLAERIFPGRKAAERAIDTVVREWLIPQGT